MMKDNRVKKPVKKQIKNKSDRGDLKGALSMLKQCHNNDAEIDEIVEKINDTHSALLDEVITEYTFGVNMESCRVRIDNLINQLEVM